MYIMESLNCEIKEKMAMNVKSYFLNLLPVRIVISSIILIIKPNLTFSIAIIWQALYLKSYLCIPRNETARPRFQFLHSWICEQFINSQVLSAYLVQQNRQTDPGNILITHRYINDCGNWETEHSVLEITRHTVSFLGIHQSEPGICS